MKEKNCSHCGKIFHCGSPGLCWCAELPAIMPLETNAGCLCKDCLVDVQNEKIYNFINSNPRDKVLRMAVEFKKDELLEKIDYLVEDGKWVFTKWFLLKRGFCCDSGCRNCPYK